MNKLFTKVATLCVGLAMAAGVGVAVGVSHVSEVKATEAEAYKLDGAVQATGTAYNGDNEVTQGGVKWIVNGNVNQTPWRIGGKNTNGLAQAGAIRKIWSQDAVTNETVSKVVLTTLLPANNSLSATSVELKVGTSKGASDTSTLSQSFGNSIVFECSSNADWSSKYFEFDFVMPQNNTGTQKYFQLSSIVFYYESTTPRGTLEITDVPHIVEVGGKFTPSYTWTPEQGSSSTIVTSSVTYTASDSEVLTKDGSTFTAAKAGFATVTLTATDSLSEQYEVVSHKVYVSNANSFAVGDKVAVVAADVLKELTGVSDGNTPYGTAADYESVPAGSFELEVESGSIDGSFAFKNTAGYLNWSSGNSLSIADSKSENTSWYVIDYDSYEVIKNCADETREIWWNNGSPRFACYTNKTPESEGYNVVSVYKLGEAPVVPTLESIAVTTQPTKTEYQIGEQLNTAGLVVTATYSDQSTADVTSQCTFSGFESETAGEKTVNVFFENHSTSFKVTVNEPAPVTYSVTYKAGDGQGTDHVVSNIEAGSKHALITFAQSEFVAPEGKQFKAWSVDSAEQQPGYEVTVNSNLVITAVYEDIPAPAGWSNEILAQFATVLHGAVPNYDDSVKTLAYNANYNMFLMPEVDSSDAAEAQLATLCTGAGWEYYSEGSFYYFDTEDGIGYAMGRVYQMSDTTYAAVLRFIQNAYEKDMADLFEEHLGIVPPYFDGFPTYIYHEGKFVCEYIDQPSDLASELSYYQDDIESYGLTSLGEARTEKIFVYNGGSSGEYNATIYAYGAYLQDGGLLIVEVYTMFDAYLGFNIYYQAMPVSIAVSGEYKTSYEYGEEFSADGIVVTATMSDATSLDVSSDVEFSGFDSSVAGEQTVTVTYGTLTTDFVVTVNQPAPVYDADAFAKELLEKVAPICANYDGKKNNRTALKEVWTEMAVKYGTLSEEEKAKVVAAAAKADGTDLEKAMAFYNFACKKYGLTKFIAGRQVKAIVNEPVQNNSILPIIVIVASSVAAVTVIGVVIALKRRKSLLTK